MLPHVTALDLIVLASYFAATLAVGIVLRGRSKSVEGYAAAGRSLPGWLTGLSILGTYVSSISFLALPGRAFASNWSFYVFSLSIPLAAWIAVRWFLPFYRRGERLSAYEHLEERFGPWARVYASACYLLTQLARMGTVMYLMALPLHVLLGWDIRWIIIVTGISVTFYTFIGGIVAVIWTDAVQTIVLILGAVACAALMLGSLPGGPSQVFTLADEHDKFSLGSFGTSLSEPTFWVVLVYGLVINLQNFGIDQNYVQRYFAARSDAEARKSIWLGGLLYVPLSAVFFFIGTALFAYYAANPGQLPLDYQEPARSDQVFPYFIVTALPSGVTGLLIAAIFAAAMSTVSSSLNSSATILFNDYYRRFRRREASEGANMRFVRVATVGWGALGTLLALAMTNARSALETWWLLAGIFGGGTLGLFLLGFLSRRASSGAALAGVSVGVALILWMTLSPRWSALPEALRSPFHGFLIIVFGTAAILGVGLLGSRLMPPIRTSRPEGQPRSLKPNETTETKALRAISRRNFSPLCLCGSCFPIRYRLMTIISSFHCLAATVFGATLVAVSAAGPVISAGFIYEEAPYPSCHASTIVEVAPGVLGAAWFGGTHERHPDVGIWFARQENARWQEAAEVATGEQPDGSRLPTWNPVLFQPKDAPLQLFYKVGPSPSTWWGMVITSTDGGRTWSEPRRLPDGILGPIKNKPVVLTDGTWLSGSSTEGNPDGWLLHFERSRDQGRTWERIGPVAKGRAFDAIQPSILFHADGQLQALARTRQGVVGMTWSKDGGETWLPVAATELPNPNSGTDAVTLADGRQLIVYNHTAHRPEESGKGNRWPLDVAVSDDGLVWQRVLTLETEPNRAGYAYPAVIQASDGKVHITYTWDRKRIKHVVVDPAEL